MEEIIDMLRKDLADNFHEEDKEVIEILIKHYTSIASDASNRKKDDELLKPYIFNAVIASYLRRGDEGSTSSKEGDLSSNYIDIEDKLRKDVCPVRLGKF